jgi:hypothetical protein
VDVCGRRGGADGTGEYGPAAGRRGKRERDRQAKDERRTDGPPRARRPTQQKRPGQASEMRTST